MLPQCVRVDDDDHVHDNDHGDGSETNKQYVSQNAEVFWKSE